MAENNVNDDDTDDRKAMLSLLKQHGLLLDLPQATFDRCVASQHRVNTICDQIYKHNVAKNAQDFADGPVKNIRRLAELPGGLGKAMHMLIDVAAMYKGSDEGWCRGGDSPVWSARDELGIMDDLMTDLIRTHYALLKSAKKDWKPVRLLETMEEEGMACWEDHNTFEDSIDLVRTVLACRTAKMLANKIVGHKLPPELVEVVQEYICSDEALLVTPTHSTYPWWSDGRRW